MKRAPMPKKISTLIIMYFSLFMVAILIAMSAISYYYSYQNMRERTIADTTVVLSQVGKNIGRYITNAKDITGIINANTDIIDTLQEDKFYNDTQKLLARRSYERFLKDIPKIGDGIVSVFIFGKDNIPIYVQDGLAMKTDYDITQDEWFKKVQDDTSGECEITGTSVRVMTKTNNPWVISLSRRIVDENNEVVGTLLLELNYAVIDSILSDINLGSKGYVFIVDSNGNMVYHPQLQLIYSGLKSENVDAVLKHSSSTIDLPEENKMYTISNVPGTDFSIVGVTFQDELVATANEMNLIYVILALL
ncbi:cache domain-containing protein, partial [Christensenella hongkongensis]